MKTPEQIGAEIIAANRYLSMATSAGGDPWVAPLAYVVDKTGDLLYYSSIESRHSRHIEKNSTIAACIFDSTAASDASDGVQLSGEVSVVGDDELSDVANLYFGASFPDPEVRKKWERPISAFSGAAPLRFYRLKLRQVFKLDLSTIEVDRRLELSLGDLVRLLCP